MHRFTGLCTAFLLVSAVPQVHAQEQPSLAVAVDVRHVSQDLWRVDYRFAHPVTAVRLHSIGAFRKQEWKVLTSGMAMTSGQDFDVIASKGKPFKAASVEIRTFDGWSPKEYVSFNRFSDGGTSVYLGHLQGDVEQGNKTVSMRTDFHLSGLARENVIAPPANRLQSGGTRGYAYFGPAQAVPAGGAKVLMDPRTPLWLRETILDVGAKTSGYYEKAYGRALKDELLIMVSVGNLESPGFSMKGGAIMGAGQISYLLEGKQVQLDHPKLREAAIKTVAHEMAHIWQMAVSRGGVGDDQGPWIHEGGAEAMALDALARTGLFSEEGVKAYRAKQAATCEQLGGAVDTYDGIYACGLMRFDKLGVGIVPLWRAMMEAAEATGAAYSQQMIDTIVSAK
ncbi:hypothetical protein G4G28_19320 [Massilia sp. Dwa41.01b]|uniref:hypothetical protein n=1 Tax=unclassified Massilia TaxID=2609279 RepID=UPI0015FF349B|nr:MULTISPECIES: hypothetical protein [unclassified Massilia]QNA90109.1 hypothetical protein G4G28_19320 [Massilia sp. Dwa41.01b]QNB00998.1 hypothetical protein G4G31_22925 [Massilia sp. Se16.2.3]